MIGRAEITCWEDMQRVQQVKIMRQLHEDLRDIFTKAIQAVDPYQSIMASVSFDGKIIRIRNGIFHVSRPNTQKAFSFDLSRGNLYVVGAGKASSRMAAAVEKIFGHAITEGIVVTKYGYRKSLKRIRQIEAGHPVPDKNSVNGAREIQNLLGRTRENDLVLVLISGGGSSLLASPADRLSLEDKQQVTQLLLSCGATIQEMNTVRKHLSGIKGGHLARMALPARVLTLILSDVIGDDLSSIASGPTAPDDTTFEDALNILSFYNVTEKVPPSVLEHFKNGAAGKIEETPNSLVPLFQRVSYRFIGSNQMALNAAAKKAQELGYHPLILTHGVCGEAREIAKLFAAIAKQLTTSRQPIEPPACILSGGEPTVTLRGKGKGGRNQEFALAAGLEIGGINNILIASVGTDGTDGPTDAAGGYADGDMLQKARDQHLNAQDFLIQNNSYPFLERLGYLIKTGPTGTNVMDIQIILCKNP